MSDTDYTYKKGADSQDWKYTSATQVYQTKRTVVSPTT